MSKGKVNCSHRSSQKVSSESRLPKTGCIFQNWELSSGRRFQHRKPVILKQCSKQIDFPFITLFWIFLGWHCKYFEHLFVPIRILFIFFCVYLRLCCWFSAVLCITQIEPTPPSLWDNSRLACFHVAARLPALLMIHLYRFTGFREKWPGEDRAEGSFFNPRFLKVQLQS